MSVIPKGSAQRIAALGVGMAVVLSISFSTQTYLAMIDHGHDFWRILVWQLTGWLYWALMTPWIVLRLCGGLGGVSLTPRTVGRVAAAGVPLVMAHLVIVAALTVALQPYVPVRAYTFAEAFTTFFQSHLFADVVLYAGLGVVGRMIAVGERARRLATREAQLEADVVRARLEALRLEIQPHFLFNTLNSIAALIRIRSNDQALKMLLGLSELMRATIDRTPSQVTTWPIELAFTKGYIELQQVRFGDRLDVAYAIDASTDGCLVPAFLLQPVVENAFRHGIGGKAGRCRLDVGASMVGGRLRVILRDDGAGLPAGFDLARHAGTGLSNIRTRLQNLYGGPASLSVSAAHGGGTLVVLDLPAEPPADLGPSLGMTGFRVVVVDDEPLARGMVGAIVQADADVASVIECGDARQVHELIAEHRPHILFLDIEMPEMSGIGIAEMVDDAGPAIVFVTAFSQYATRAFDVKAIDYVLKPFSDDRLRDALERAKRRIRERRLGELAHELTSLSANLPATPREPAAPAVEGHAARPYLQRLAFKVGDKSVVLKTGEIHWIEAEDYYVLLHTTRGRHLVRVSMASLEAELDPAVFVRAHRAAIVNLDAVQELTIRDDSCLRLIDGTRVPVSRARRRHVEAAIGARG